MKWMKLEWIIKMHTGTSFVRAATADWTSRKIDFFQHHILITFCHSLECEHVCVFIPFSLILESSLDSWQFFSQENKSISMLSVPHDYQSSNKSPGLSCLFNCDKIIAKTLVTVCLEHQATRSCRQKHLLAQHTICILLLEAFHFKVWRVPKHSNKQEK